MAAITPSMARQLVLEDFRRSLVHRTPEDLRECCSRLAELALVTQPAAMAYLAQEAAALLVRRDDSGQLLMPAPEPWQEQLATELLGPHH